MALIIRSKYNLPQKKVSTLVEKYKGKMKTYENYMVMGYNDTIIILPSPMMEYSSVRNRISNEFKKALCKNKIDCIYWEQESF